MQDQTMEDVDDHTEAAAEIVVDDLLLKIFRLTPSENDPKPQFKLASEHFNSLISDYYPYIQLSLVSRHWNSLISNNFRPSLKPVPATGLIFECPSSQRTTHSSHSYILFLDQSISTTAPFRKINSVDHPWHYRSKVVHSCNGLLLCASKWAHGIYSVCNPTTGKHSALPQVPPADRKKICGAFLAFDPCKSPHYKVVCVLRSEDDTRYCQFVVYSSKTGSWGKCGKRFRIKTLVCFGKGVFWNGSIHWVGSSKLIRFNPGDDCEERLPAPKVMPMPIARNHQHCYFGESCGHLHYIGLDDEVRELVVHEMMSSDYSDGWVVKFKFDVSNAVREGTFYRGFGYFNVYAVVRGERDEDTVLVLGTSRWRPGGSKKIVRFNHDATFETIFHFDAYENPLKNPGEFTYPFQYIESLASV